MEKAHWALETNANSFRFKGFKDHRWYLIAEVSQSAFPMNFISDSPRLEISLSFELHRKLQLLFIGCIVARTDFVSNSFRFWAEALIKSLSD